MRRALLWLWCYSLLAAEQAHLQQLADNNRIFELRRALQEPNEDASAVLLYRGIVECRFGHEDSGIDLLRRFLSATGDSKARRQAEEEMAAAFQRIGRYKEAAQAWSEALRLTPADDPERAGNENSRALYESLGDVDSQSARFEAAEVPVKATRNRVGSWNVPVQIGGITGQWIFDAGANLSTLSASEAKRMGLAVHDSRAYVTGSTAKKNALRWAVADDLQFGSAHIRKVIFLVLGDQALNITQLHYQITGILGLPVLRALRTVAISAHGVVHIDPPARSSAGAANLFFDESSPIGEISHNGHRLQFFLDTGANDSVLYPSFREALTAGERSRLKRKSEQVAGAGGMLKRKIEIVPRLQIDILEKTVELKQVSLLSDMPTGNNRYRDGVVGMNALWNGFVLDWQNMRLQIE